MNGMTKAFFVASSVSMPAFCWRTLLANSKTRSLIVTDLPPHLPGPADAKT